MTTAVEVIGDPQDQQDAVSIAYFTLDDKGAPPEKQRQTYAPQTTFGNRTPADHKQRRQQPLQPRMNHSNAPSLDARMHQRGRGNEGICDSNADSSMTVGVARDGHRKGQHLAKERAYTMKRQRSATASEYPSLWWTARRLRSYFSAQLPGICTDAFPHIPHARHRHHYDHSGSARTTRKGQDR